MREHTRITEKLFRTYKEKSEINRKLQITYGEKFDRGVEIKKLKKELAETKKELTKTQKKLSGIQYSATYRVARVIGFPIRMIANFSKKRRNNKKRGTWNMKKVSVIIPVYNVEEYLEECMESVIHQTLKEIEILCVNDGSTDHSLQILEQYAKKDDRIRIISQKNGGYGKAMNQGLDAASGEYIGIVEPDDYVPLNMYEDLYRKAKETESGFCES